MEPLSPADLPADPRALGELALATAVTAADMVRSARLLSFGVETKSTATDMVTDVDRACDALVRRLLTDARPDDGLLTEEDTDHIGTSGVVWVVDPIDGTTNFVYGHSPYQVSIAATVAVGLPDGGIDYRPFATAVVEISRDERYSAVLDGGATCNGLDLRVTTPPALGQALVGTGFAYDPARRSRQAHLVARIIGRIRDIRRCGAAAYDLCSIAANRIDGYYEHGLGPWDLAGGRLIVTEAGGAVEGLLTEHPDPAAGILAAHPDLIGPLRDLLVENEVHTV